MIPNFNLNGVLPPFIGETPGDVLPLSSPYQCSSIEIVTRFATTDHRRQLLRGFFQFRSALREAGVQIGFQWLDGSFTEDVEASGRQPNDIDVVTLVYRPEMYLENDAWNGFFENQMNGGIFDLQRNREIYTCDTFFVDLNVAPHMVARRAAYWSSLFSHRRNTFQWKGMLALSLGEDDTDAIMALEVAANE